MAPVNFVRQFENSLQKIARMLSDKWGISVIFRADECKTDGRTIYLPVIPKNASQEFLDVVHGYLDHEVGHIIFTEFGKEYPNLDSKTRYVANALEDARIEAKMRAMWRGCGVNLRRTREFCYERLRQRWGELSGFGIFAQAVGISACNVVEGGEANQAMCDWLAQQSPMEWIGVGAVQDIIDRIARLDLTENVDPMGTQRTIEMAKEIVERLQGLYDEAKERQEQEEQQDQEQEQGEGDSNFMDEMFGDAEESEDEEQEGASAGEGDEGEEQEGQTQEGGKGDREQSDTGADHDGDDDDDQSDSSGSGSEDNDEDESESADGSSSEDADDSDESDDAGGTGPEDMDWWNDPQGQDQLSTGELIKKEIDEKRLQSSDSYLIYTTEDDEIERISSGDRARYTEWMNEAKSLVGPLHKKLTLALQAVNRSGWERNKTRGMLDPRALYKLGVLEESTRDLPSYRRAFQRRFTAPGFDTIVSMTLDHSGSMWGRPLQLAGETAIILGEVLYRLNIPFEVFGHSTGAASIARNRWHQASPQAQRDFTRWGNLWIGMYKSFSDNWPTVRHNLASTHNQCRMNSFDAEALIFAARRMIEQGNHRRRIIFELKDGMPCPNVGQKMDEHRNYLKHVVELLAKAGIEVIGVGMRSDCVKHFYPNWVVVNDLKELPKVVLGELSKILMRGKNQLLRRAV